LIKSCQEQGGIPVLIDTEGSVNKEFMNAIGVDVESVIISEELKTMEKIYSYLEKVGYLLRTNYPDAPILFIIDSITAALTERDLDNKDYENKGYNAGLKAKQHSEALRKWSSLCTKLNICLIETSQLRADMNVLNPYMDKYQSSSGGMALQFYASLRLRLKKRSKIK
jgi:RecA/RadA recombinase